MPLLAKRRNLINKIKEVPYKGDIKRQGSANYGSLQQMKLVITVEMHKFIGNIKFNYSIILCFNG